MTLLIPSRMRLASSAVLAMVVAAGLNTPLPAQSVLTFFGSNGRQGVQPKETALTLTSVNKSTFGKLRSFAVDGDVYAEPLYLTSLLLKDGKKHNILFVATAHDWVYAFDADGNNPASGYIWKRSLLGTGETWVSSNDVNSDDIKPDIGIIGTPVVDLTNSAIYVVAKSKKSSGSAQFFQRLHALNLVDGAEKLHGPTLIQASVSGTGDGVSTVSFNPMLNNQRAALLLTTTPGQTATSSVFITWSSHGDQGRYRGWVISYNAADISKRTGAWADTPDDAQGGIWMSGGGLSSDGSGKIYAATGNGGFNVNSGGRDYGDSLVRLQATSPSLPVGDWFTPTDQFSLSARDADFGTAQPMLLPSNISKTVANLMMTVDKSGTIYLINRDNMGHYNTSTNHDVQDFSDGGFTIHSNLVFFNNRLYLAPDGGPVLAWTFQASTTRFVTTPVSQTTVLFGCNQCNGSGSNFQISANGTQNGIVWALNYSNYGTGPAILYAFDATNLATELYSSLQATGGRDQGPIAVKFTTPTVANGHVYIGGRNSVVEYGLLHAPAALEE